MRKQIKKIKNKSVDGFHSLINKIVYIWKQILLFFKEKGKLKKIKRLFKKIHSFFKRKYVYQMFLFRKVLLHI